MSKNKKIDKLNDLLLDACYTLTSIYSYEAFEIDHPDLFKWFNKYLDNNHNEDWI